MDLRLMVVALAALAARLASAQLVPGFYKASCPQAEAIVQRVVAKHFKQDRTVTAAMIRLYFHDCFSNGCDASIHIEPTTRQSSERDSGANLSVRGFDIIEEAKGELEAKCPGFVSCADVIALATRDAVKLAGGPDYAVPTGRRDSLSSNQDDANNLPAPDISVTEALDLFAKKGFTPEEFVVLMGAHTVGVAHCFFVDQQAAPIDPTYKAKVSKLCGGGGERDASDHLDQSTPEIVDNKYYGEILALRSPLTTDRLVATDKRTAPIVKKLFANPTEFATKFASALVKLGSLKVITGKDGEVRTKCGDFNSPTAPTGLPNVSTFPLPGDKREPK